MGYRVNVDTEALTIDLTGGDAVISLRRKVQVPANRITSVTVAPRDEFELSITTDSSKKSRVGAFLGPATVKHEFWAVGDGDNLVAVDIVDPKWSRIVLEVDDPEKFAAELRRNSTYEPPFGD